MQVALSWLGGPSPDWVRVEQQVADLFDPGLPGNGYGGGGSGWQAVRRAGVELLGKLRRIRGADSGGRP